MMKHGKVLAYDPDHLSGFFKALGTCMISLAVCDDVKIWVECPYCGGQFTKVVDVSRTNVVRCKHCKEKFRFD